MTYVPTVGQTPLSVTLIKVGQTFPTLAHQEWDRQECVSYEIFSGTSASNNSVKRTLPQALTLRPSEWVMLKEGKEAVKVSNIEIVVQLGVKLQLR